LFRRSLVEAGPVLGQALQSIDKILPRDGWEGNNGVQKGTPFQ
jgi:hypothetical protein